jgi:hypothetical protein
VSQSEKITNSLFTNPLAAWQDHFSQLAFPGIRFGCCFDCAVIIAFDGHKYGSSLMRVDHETHRLHNLATSHAFFRFRQYLQSQGWDRLFAGFAQNRHIRLMFGESVRKNHEQFF